MCRMSRTDCGPPSQRTCRIASSPSVGRRGVDAIQALLTKEFVTVNENLRQGPLLQPGGDGVHIEDAAAPGTPAGVLQRGPEAGIGGQGGIGGQVLARRASGQDAGALDRKSTRLNSSHVRTSYA